MKKTKNKNQFTSEKSNETKKLLVEVKKIFPKLDFFYDKDSGTIRSESWVHHSGSDFSFRVSAYITNVSYLRMRFSFGEIKLNPEALYFVNVFNRNSPSYYKAYVTENNDYNMNYFYIEFSKESKDIEDAAKNFEGAMDYMNIGSMAKLIKPIYVLITSEKVSIKEMS